MRPLIHPSINDVSVEAVLHALADPVRVAIYAGIASAECPQICANFQTISKKNIPKSTLSQHFKALREAGLIRSERCGVEMRNTTRCAELEERFPGLVRAILGAYKTQCGESGKRRRKAVRR